MSALAAQPNVISIEVKNDSIPLPAPISFPAVDEKGNQILNNLVQGLTGTEALTATTVTSAGSVLNGGIGELRNLQALQANNSLLLNQLEANRDNLQQATKICRDAYSNISAPTADQSWWNPSKYFSSSSDSVKDSYCNCFRVMSKAEDLNDEQFQSILKNLRENSKEVSERINQVQKLLDTIGIAIIAVNMYMVYDNVQFWVSSSKEVEGYKKSILKIIERMNKCIEWYENPKTVHDQRANDHFRSNIQEIYGEFQIIELKLKLLREKSSSKGIKSAMTAVASLGIACVLPVSSPFITYGLLAAAPLNLASSGLCFKVVGEIDKLLPEIETVKAMYLKATKIPTEDSMPHF